MRRRDFLGVVSGAAVALPFTLRAQQPERVRYMGMINTLGSDDPETQARIAVFEQALAELGWVIGRNLKVEIRQIGGDLDHGRFAMRGQDLHHQSIQALHQGLGLIHRHAGLASGEQPHGEITSVDPLR